VIGFLRFVGIVNTAVWFGATLFFTLAVWPAFFSPEMKGLLGRAFPIYSEPLALVLLGKFYLVQQVCGAVALFHLLLEWLYSGRGQPKFLVFALLGVFAVGLIGGYAVKPQMRTLHDKQYDRGYSAEQKKKLANGHSLLRGFVHVTNALACVTLLVYMWRLSNPPDAPRFGKRR
jgi:hypothetical protein